MMTFFYGIYLEKTRVLTIDFISYHPDFFEPSLNHEANGSRIIDSNAVWWEGISKVPV